MAPIVLWLPGILTPTLNVSLRQHWGKRQQGTRAMAWAIRVAHDGALPAVPFERAHVRIERRQPGNTLPDHDGLVGGCKGLIDCLLPFHEKRRKFGLGFVLDDSPKHMRLDIAAARVPRAAIGMHITITSEGPDR